MAHSASYAQDKAAPARQAGRRSSPPMFAPFEWWVAWRYLRAKKKENFASIITILSGIGIALGVATLITVMAVMNGFRGDLMDRILGVRGHISVQELYGPLEDFDAVADRVRQVQGVTDAMPIVEGGVIASKEGRFGYKLVRGIRQSDLKNMSLVANNIVAGSLDDFQGSRTIAIGTRGAMSLGVGLGDKITLITPKGRTTAFGTTPREKAYKIGAIFQVGMSDIDASLIYMPLEQAQLYFSTGGGVTQVDVMIEDPDLVKDMRVPVLNAAGGTTRAEDWQQVNSAFVGALQVERVVMFIILTLILVVAGLNIISGQVMQVKDKSRDIAVLRTMGATSGTVLRVFLITGASIGVVGTAIGFVLGLLLCYNIDGIRRGLEYVLQTELFNADVYFLSKMTAQIDNGEVLAVLAFSLVLSLLAPLYPAWRAAKVDPVEALRYE